MNENSTFQVSQGFDVLKPKSGEAYPIPCEEWKYLRGKIAELSSNRFGKLTIPPWLLQVIGGALLGAALSTSISILAGAIYATSDHPNVVVNAWVVSGAIAFGGILCLILSHMQSGIRQGQASDIAAQMEIIEKRYERQTA